MAKTKKPRKPKITRPELVTEKNRRAGILILLGVLAIPGFIYGGVPFLIPYAATVGMFYLCGWLMPAIARPMFTSFALHAGLIVFQIVALVGVLMKAFSWPALYLWVDIPVALGLLVWLMWKPGMWPASFLMIFDAMVLLLTFDMMEGMAVPVLLFRVIWPVAAVVTMFLGMHRVGVFRTVLPGRKDRQAELQNLMLRTPKKTADGEKQEAARNDPVSRKKKKRRD